MFDAIIHASLRQRVLVLAFATLLVTLGAISLRSTPVDVFPNLDKPTVTLMTEAGGMAPEEVEQLVSFPIEAAMNGMPGVMRVRSISGVGLSIVYVEFEWGTDIYRSRQLVSERLGLVRERLPADVVPQMGPIASIMGEIVLIALPADPDRADPMRVREYADWVMRPRLLSVPGVAQVIAIGGQVKQYRVEPDPARLRAADIELAQVERALRGFGLNTAGGFVEAGGREYLIRNIGRTHRLEDLRNLPVATRDGRPVLLHQLAAVGFAPAVKRGDAGYQGRPAVILSVQKQPSADSVRLTGEIERAVAELSRSRPAGIEAPAFLFRQADFIQASVDNVRGALRDGALMVAIVLFMFLVNLRTTVISLLAIPISLLAAVLVFRYLGLSINTMTLGGLAIAIGELVDDAVVDVENVMRRLRENRRAPDPRPAIEVVARASIEVRTGVVYATLIVVLVFVPLFALPGIEGRLFTPLGIAYIVSILASMGVAMTVTPVLCYLLLPRMRRLDEGDSALVRVLKRWNAWMLERAFDAGLPLLALATAGVAIAAAALMMLPRAFLPPFNEGTLTVNLLMNPGTSLAESNRIGMRAEAILLTVPEVAGVGRRTGRAELDEHAEGVHSTEIEVDLRRLTRSREQVVREIREQLATLAAVINVGQPISHRLDHLLSGVRAQIALKVFGDDLDTLRALAETLREKIAKVPGVTDLQIEKQVLIPQFKVRVDHDAAARHGLGAGELMRRLERLLQGERVGQVIEGNRRFDLSFRLADPDRDQAGLPGLLIDTPLGRVPLSRLAVIEDGLGPNQIGHENTRRRIVLSANSDVADIGRTVESIRELLGAQRLPEGYFTVLEGQFLAQEQAAKLIAWLALVALAMIALVLYSRYRSLVLTAIVMGNVPLALVGSVAALWLSGQPLSVAALVGFITLAGIATRNGILKISHYVNLCRFEGEQFGRPMIVRGSLERLTPVLMTALVAAFALLPLLVSADRPGREILHPVAVVIFGGLISSTLLDTVITPVMFWLFGRRPLERLLAERATQAY